jgi:GTP-dependent phosphoenolpyruvate carboxykinase
MYAYMCMLLGRLMFTYGTTFIRTYIYGIPRISPTAISSFISIHVERYIEPYRDIKAKKKKKKNSFYSAWVTTIPQKSWMCPSTT